MANSPTSSCPLVLRLFGDFEILIHGERATDSRSRTKGLMLALLTLRHAAPVSRDELASLLWPESDLPQTLRLNYVRRYLSRIRDLLGSEAWRLSPGGSQMLSLDLNGADVDVIRFDSALDGNDISDLQTALALYRHPLLHRCTLEWAGKAREQKHRALCEALRRAGAHALANREPAEAEKWFREACRLAPFWEPAQRGHMEALAAGNQVDAACRLYRDYTEQKRKAAKRDDTISAAPEPETTALFHVLRDASRRLSGGQAVDVSGFSLAARSAQTLPRFLTPLIGRQDALEEITMRLNRRRLVTLTGPGGIGKTRLAAQAAADQLHQYPDGVWFVDFGPIQDPSLAAQAVATILGASDLPTHARLRSLTDFISTKNLLIVLDNCEHLHSACADLAREVLLNCPNARLLATSRQSLGVVGQTAWCVPSLVLPEQAAGQNDDLKIELIEGSPAVQLFCERASEVRNDFALSAENVSLIARLCRFLDGIPLALELAAARLSILTVGELAERLDGGIYLLGLGDARRLSRHQTLRTMIECSYDLLTEAEQRLFARLSVFRGGFTLAAAEQICGNEQADITQVSAWLEGLVDKSLVCAEVTQDGMRYRLLEILRQFGGERLESRAYRGEAAAIRRRHAQWFAEFAGLAEPKLRGPDQVLWLKRLDRERDNLRAALDECCAKKNQATALLLGSALWHYWEMCGHITEGRARLEAILRLPRTNHDTAARAITCIGACLLADQQSDYAAAAPLAEEGVSLACEAMDESLKAWAFQIQGWENRHVDPIRTEQLLNQALAIARGADDTWRIADILSTLGFYVMDRGDLERGETLLRQGLNYARQTEDAWLIGELVYHIGLATNMREDYAGAINLLEQALEMQSKLSDRAGMGTTLHHLADAYLLSTNPLSAQENYKKSLLIAHELQRPRAVAAALDGLGSVAVQCSQFERAVCLFSAAEAVRGMEPLLFSGAKKHYDRFLLLARTTLDPNRCSAVRTLGQAMTTEQAVQYALENGRV